ncbi:dystrotelin isoform X1 [Podarcis lilfordi]|uniref:Dystrotelin isoform X1 n=1 Tax=Podarcis lilfordi TaxID=74358 RepID=A0AA35JLN8_9SAUR|nr:dystrotelin isoform X1 [Podarcis lilfordi]
MDLDQQEALNTIENSVYRTALKLRAVQSLCQLKLTDVSSIQQILPNHKCRAEKQKPLSMEQLTRLLKELFKRTRLEKPGQVEPKAAELTLSLLTSAYDRNGVGFIQPRSAAAALIALSGDGLLTKYRGLFQLYSTCAGRSASRTHISRNGVRNLLTDLLQILAVVGERRNLSNVEIAVTSCFSGVLGSAVDEERFLAWLQSEPAILLWLPTCYRLSATEMVKHQVKCNICKSFPITGLRYRCLKCLNFDICQVCFFTGQLCKPHKKSHPVMEHCVPVSTKERTKLFFRIIRNNLLQGRCERKEALRRKTLMVMGDAGYYADSHAHFCSRHSTSSRQHVPSHPICSVRTLDQQLSSPLDAKVSQGQTMANNNSLLCQEKTSSQTLASIKAELAKTQESIKALHSERRYLKKQLNKCKGKMQLLHSAQEDRNRALQAKFRELLGSQDSLKLELQEMREEIKNIAIWSKEPLKERNLQTRSGCPSLKPNRVEYSKYKSPELLSSWIKRKWLWEPQGGLLARNAGGSPENTLRAQFFPNAPPEVAHHESPQERTAPLTDCSEANRERLSNGIRSISPNYSTATEALHNEMQMEEEELQQLMMKLKDALSVQVWQGQFSVLKEGLLLTAKNVCKSFSDLISQVTLPTRKYGYADIGSPASITA